MPYDQLNYSKTYFNFIFYILIHLKSFFFVVGFEVVCGSLMVSYMPSLMCVEIGLWFTYYGEKVVCGPPTHHPQPLS